MTSPARIVFLRHGRTVANASGQLLGRLDPPLDDYGLQQARSIAEAITSSSYGQIQAVVSSPLQRAVQTAEFVGLPVEIDDRFIEMDYGEFDGVPISDIPLETWSRWRNDLRFAPPGGESLHDVGERVRGACRDLADRARNEGTLLVVSHVSPIKAAVAWALGIDDSHSWRTHLDTASMSIVDVDRDKPVLRGFNITSI